MTTRSASDSASSAAMRWFMPAKIGCVSSMFVSVVGEGGSHPQAYSGAFACAAAT